MSCRLLQSREEINKNLKNTKEKVRSLEVTLREVEARSQELKQAMKEAAESEYTVSQKLAYEKRARRDLEVEFDVALKSLQNN
jgi:septal ring factor EnvC (AmiA/AmiB activator)